MSMFRKNLSRLVVCLMFIVLISVSFYSKVAESLGPEAVEAEIQRFYDGLVSSQYVTADGQLLIENVGDYYAVTFPALVLEIGDMVVDLGIIAANVTEEDQELSASIALPADIAVLDKQGRVVRKVTLGQQKNSIRWKAGQVAPHYISMALSKILLEDAVLDIVYSVDAVEVLSERGDVPEDAIVTMKVKNLVPQDDVHAHKGVRVGDLTLFYDVNGVKNGWIAPLETLFYQGTALNMGNVPLVKFGYMNLKMLAHDVRLPRMPFSRGMQLVDSLEIDKQLSMNEQERISGTFKTKMKRTDMNGDALFFPVSVDISMALQDMPYKEFYQKSLGIMPLNQEEDISFFELFSNPTSQLSLENMTVEFLNGAQLTGQGIIRHDQAARLNTIADVEFGMRNIGNFVTDIQSIVSGALVKGLNPNVDQVANPGMSGMSAFVLMPLINMMGANEVDEQGQEVKKFHFRLDKTGDFTLNNAPINGFLPK